MDFINGLKSADETEVACTLQNFITENASSFTFPSLNDCTIQTEIWNILFERLENENSSKYHLSCLQILKILSRDKQFLDNIVTPHMIDVLVASANVNPKSPDDLASQYEAISESQKCIFNLVFNHLKSRDMFLDSSLLQVILLRLSTYDSTNLPHNIIIFDLKIMFILTALSCSCRSSLRYNMKGIHHLAGVLDKCLEKVVPKLDDNTVDTCCEALKIIFNLLLSTEKNCETDNDEHQLNVHLMRIIRQLLSVQSNSLAKQEELKNHVVNLLTNLSPDCSQELIPICDNNFEASFCGRDVSSVIILLDFMDNQLDKPTAALKEGLMPILSVLIAYSSNERVIRKYLRSRVLPPLRDVTHRPEVGNELRNKLCRLMTCTITQVEFLVAEFIFVLCKENVRRLIKYTGYGNAAGLLAHRGLMMGSPSNQPAEYSSDSEDSETEEYKQMEENINPVTGSYEPPRQNPLEQMTEEQKEYEAIKLVNMIDKLQKKGIIQPARIGEDGKPRAIEHVLELQED